MFHFAQYRHLSLLKFPELHLGIIRINRPVLILAAILSLDSADKGSIGAIAMSLKSDLHMSNGEIGMLAAVVSVVSALSKRADRRAAPAASS